MSRPGYTTRLPHEGTNTGSDAEYEESRAGDVLAAVVVGSLLDKVDVVRQHLRLIIGGIRASKATLAINPHGVGGEERTATRVARAEVVEYIVKEMRGLSQEVANWFLENEREGWDGLVGLESAFDAGSLGIGDLVEYRLVFSRNHVTFTFLYPER